MDKVMCRCGKEMKSVSRRISASLTYQACYRCQCGWQSPVQTGESEEEAIEAAYAAATRRPPNKALTLEKVRKHIGEGDWKRCKPLYYDTPPNIKYGYVTRWKGLDEIEYIIKKPDNYGKTFIFWEEEPTDKERNELWNVKKPEEIYVEQEVYESATSRSPDKALTLPMLFDLDPDSDAVWIYDSRLEHPIIAMNAEAAAEWASDADTVLFFSHKPTTADIEAARKEREHAENE